MNCFTSWYNMHTKVRTSPPPTASTNSGRRTTPSNAEKIWTDPLTGMDVLRTEVPIGVRVKHVRQALAQQHHLCFFRRPPPTRPSTCPSIPPQFSQGRSLAISVPLRLPPPAPGSLVQETQARPGCLLMNTKHTEVGHIALGGSRPKPNYCLSSPVSASPNSSLHVVDFAPQSTTTWTWNESAALDCSKTPVFSSQQRRAACNTSTSSQTGCTDEYSARLDARRLSLGQRVCPYHTTTTRGCYHPHPSTTDPRPHSPPPQRLISGVTQAEPDPEKQHGANSKYEQPLTTATRPRRSSAVRTSNEPSEVVISRYGVIFVPPPFQPKTCTTGRGTKSSPRILFSCASGNVHPTRGIRSNTELPPFAETLLMKQRLGFGIIVTVKLEAGHQTNQPRLTEVQTNEHPSSPLAGSENQNGLQDLGDFWEGDEGDEGEEQQEARRDDSPLSHLGQLVLTNHKRKHERKK